MGSNGNVNAWLDAAPDQVRETTQELLSQVEAMRDAQTIYPPQDDILNALAFTAPADVRVVILGQDPYHGLGQAMGLSFSVPAGCKLPPSLRNMYKEMAADLGCPIPASGDLTSWAAQGVLLLNTTLTVREHAAASHAKLGWRVLTDHVVRRCLEVLQPVVFLTWGKHAIDLVDGAWKAVEAGPAAASLANKHVLRSTHPSPLSASRHIRGMTWRRSLCGSGYRSGPVNRSAGQDDAMRPRLQDTAPFLLPQNLLATFLLPDWSLRVPAAYLQKRPAADSSACISSGFARCAFIPAAFDFLRSSSKALAAMAMMGTVDASGRSSARMARVAS